MAAQVLSFSVEPVGLAEAAAAFLGECSLARTSRRVYALTLGRLEMAVGSAFPAGELDAATLKQFLATAYPNVKPATWNRNVATLKSFCGYCRRQGWMVSDPTGPIERRRVDVDETRAIDFPELEALWGRRDVPVREKALWRPLYDTAARASEILALDVDDVDLPNRRARVVSKGGAIEWVHFASGSARLLPRVIRDRKEGPLFLASLRPVPARAPAATDLDPVLGRARLSYRQAEELFDRYSGGRTLHQLRHSALTHLAEAGVSEVMLMARVGTAPCRRCSATPGRGLRQ
ncbi:MAG TPA: site-specific integrase [Actinomycetota bacterium]|nr:site-specific integrase [Actinomycetota bacterium]